MKNYLPFLSLLALISGCDSPQRGRTPTTYVMGNTFETGSSLGTTTTPTVPTSTPTTTTTGTTTTSPGFEACDLSDRYRTIDTGLFGLCQNTQDETLFKFKPTLTSSTVRTCLIPTYKDSNGASTYIGNPQCTMTVSNQVMQGRLFKDRSGFSNYPLNGVIVIQEPLIPEYIACMQGYTNFPRNACPNGGTSTYCVQMLNQCPYGARSNALCDTEARNYMATLCNSFKTRYTNSYIDIRTKN